MLTLLLNEWDVCFFGFRTWMLSSLVSSQAGLIQLHWAKGWRASGPCSATQVLGWMTVLWTMLRPCLRLSTPTSTGLYATTSLALLSTLPEPAQGFVQILNVSANHWVTVSDIGCQGGSVNIFDSLGHTRTEVFIEQVTGLLAFPGKSVRLQGSDCGLFAIANSFALCSGEGPTTVQYHQGQMRSHLFSCFQAGEVQLFPRAMRSPTAEPLAIDVDVHCLCRRTIGQGKAPLVPCRRCDRPSQIIF